MWPQPMTQHPAFFRALSTNPFHSLMLNEMSQLNTSPYRLAASAISYLIFQMLLYYLSVVDMIESSKSGIAWRNYPISSVVSSIKSRWSVQLTGITEGCRCRVTDLQEYPSIYSMAFRFFPNMCLAFSTATKIFQYFVVFRRITCRFLSIFAQLMSSLVIIPRVPSEPINSCLRSIPVLSFLIVDLISNIVPSATTVSNPNILPRSGPCFTKYLPAACVEAFPPIWQDPLAPRSKGTQQLCFPSQSFNFSRTHPAQQLKTPLIWSNPSILLNFLILRIIQSNTGTLPPTNPVFPPWGTTASLRLLQYFRIALTCLVFQGRSTSLDCPIYILRQHLLYIFRSQGSVSMCCLPTTFQKKCMSSVARLAKFPRLTLENKC